MPQKPETDLWVVKLAESIQQGGVLTNAGMGVSRAKGVGPDSSTEYLEVAIGEHPGATSCKVKQQSVGKETRERRSSNIRERDKLAFIQVER